MADFIKFYDEKSKLFHVEEEQNSDYRISFVDEDKAHQWMLALRLGNALPPKQAPQSYRFLREDEGLKYFQALEDLDVNSDWDPGSCCQSGCPGCPWTKANLS